jgi:hypothetical protein
MEEVSNPERYTFRDNAKILTINRFVGSIRPLPQELCTVIKISFGQVMKIIVLDRFHDRSNIL